MKVLLFTHIHPSSFHPTRGTFNGNIFRALSSHCEVKLVSPEPWWVRRRDLWMKAPQENFTGVDASYPTYWSVPRVPLFHATGMYVSLRAYIARLRRNFPFEIILAAWGYPDGVAAAHLARDFGCPLVVKIMGSDINAMPRYPMLRRQIQWGLSHSQRVVTVSRALQHQVAQLGIPDDRVIVQHNGVNGVQFVPGDRHAARTALGLPQEGQVICYVGRLSHEKGVDVLIDAMGYLRRERRSDVSLIVIGGGAEEVHIRALVSQHQLQTQVQFYGDQAHEKIPIWIRACDVFCLPSRQEGCPNVVLEALASGRPVVASHVGGLPELIQDNNGILVPAEDASALAEGLHRALAQTWDSEALRQSVEFLSWDDVGVSYHHILQSVLKEWTGGG